MYYNLFADLLTYPNQAYLKKAIELSEKIMQELPFLSEHLNKFIETISKCSQEKLEELYTMTFDLQAICYPYAGYHLFGEDYRRGLFMARLKQEFQRYGFTPPKSELPDHIGVLLRFYGEYNREPVLREECLLVVFEKLLSSFRDKTENPYYHLLMAIYEALKSEQTQLMEKQISREFEGGIRDE